MAVTYTSTPEDIAEQYDRALSCVWHINNLNPNDPDMATRCVEHLKRVVENPWWDGYDLAPFYAAIATGEQR